MARYRIERTDFTGFPAIRVRDTQGGTECLVAERGATLLSFRVPWESGLYEVIEGYTDGKGLTALSGSHSALMLPFTNRIADGCYAFEGQRFCLPGRRADGNAMHGLVRDVDWTLTDSSEEEGWLLWRCDALAEGTADGYPFAVECFARFRLDGGRLELALSAANRGQSDAPLAMGWHPYFRAPGGDIGDCLLQLPATHCVATDDRLLPLPGDRAYKPVAEAGRDYRNPRPLGQTSLDTCFAGLQADVDGWSRTRLTDPASGYELVLAQTGGAVQVFTPRPDNRASRPAIAIEPTEFIPDAFNRPEYLTAIPLGPGQTRRFMAQLSAGFNPG